MTLERRIYDGQRAREVLDNEAYQGAIAEVEQELTERWKTAPIADRAGRERAFQLLTALRMVQAALQRTLETGKLAHRELEHQRSIAARAKDAWSNFSSE